MDYTRLILTSIKGGRGSGYFGHAGRPGKRGGSAASVSAGYYSSGGVPINDDTAWKVESSFRNRVYERGYDLGAIEQGVQRVSEWHVFVRVTPETLVKIIEDGRLKNQYEAGRSGGYFNPNARINAESSFFGETRERKDRPIYGYLYDKLEGSDSKRDHALDQYGSIVIGLDDSVRERTSFLNGDSFAEGSRFATFGSCATAPSPMLNPRAFSFGLISGKDASEIVPSARHVSMRGYFEAQIHGGVKLSGIRRVRISEKDKIKVSSETLSRIRDAGIRVDWIE